MAVARMSKAERTLPVALSIAMFVLVALVLPTVLRPTDPLTNESAEFSPDAPPDEQESIVEALNRGTSATAGSGEGEGENTGEGPGDAPGGPPVQGPASRGKCFGTPPRQVESPYSPPCVPAFVGDNGGGTWAGVSPTEFRVAVYVFDGDDSDEGPVDDEDPYRNLTESYLLAMQNWFNKHFEFYGRQMRIFIVKQSLASTTQGSAAAIRAKQQYDVFAAGDALTTNPGTFGESINQGIVTWVGWVPEAYLEDPDNRPYAWSFFQSVDKSVNMSTELVCKQFAGRPPEFNERMDPSFNYSAPRRFGLFLLEDSIRNGMEALIKANLKKCGVTVEHTVKASFENADASKVAAAMTQFRANNVTTILHYAEHASADLLTAEATRINYWPEWFVAGVGGADVNELTQNQDQRQWAHAFGLSQLEIPRPPQYRSDVRAVREVDPGSNYRGQGALSFTQLFAIASGVQMAGHVDNGRLTPQAFEKGLFTIKPRPPDPIWSQGGGYGPGDHAYVDYNMLIWWDAETTAADNGAKGTYRYMFGGKHYREGEFPEEPLPWFKDGIITPADPNARNTDRTEPRP